MELLTCACGIPHNTLTHARLGREDGIRYYNCPCGSTYALTEQQFWKCMQQTQERIARGLIPPNRWPDVARLNAFLRKYSFLWRKF